VTTATNIYALDADNLAVLAQLSPTDLPEGAGFARTVPSVSGNLVFVTRDNGEQLVLDARTLQPVPTKVFEQHPDNAGAKFGAGQPALSHLRHAIFWSDRGLFVHRIS
jgi:hypothetical protein